MGSVKKLVLVGSGDITPRQARILFKHFGDHVIVKHIYVITEADVERVKPVSDCSEEAGEICVDAVVFFKILSKPAEEFIKKGIDVYDFEVAPSPDGKGDLHGGKAVTVGLRRYDLKPKSVARWVYAE